MEIQQKFCHECGNRLSENMKFCVQCGAKLLLLNNEKGTDLGIPEGDVDKNCHKETSLNNKTRYYYFEVFSKYADFTGRADGKEFWLFMVVNIAVYIVLAMVEYGKMGINPGNGNGPLTVTYQLFTLIPSIAVGIRRMHDVGRSGWYTLLPVINIIFACMPGEKGANKYGPSLRISN